MNHESLKIEETLVRCLVATQFPQWKDLPVRPVAESGWDNRTFHLGEEMLVRMPSAEDYAAQVEKEQRWLPILAPLLTLHIPVPLAIGEPVFGYPWEWSIYRWLEGNTIASSQKPDLSKIATQLAKFLMALHKIDTTDESLAGPHSFYCGGDP
jgi:aminoglycoside phosphotransferase (APT) family kinase protein